MRNNKLDHLFRNALGNQKIEPSPVAWEKLEGQLHKKKKGYLWRWSVAAAVLMLVIWAGWMAWEPGARDPMVSDRVGAPADRAEQNNTVAPDMPAHRKEKPIVGEPDQTLSGEPGPKIFELNNEQVAAAATLKEDMPAKAASILGEASAMGSQLSEIVAEAGQEPGHLDLTVMPEQEEAASGMAHAEHPASPVVKVPIRIVYKRTNDADVLAASDQNILKKGFKKLGRITEDLRLSEATREKLRDTKDDFLALNVDKIFKRNESEQTDDHHE